MNVRKPRLPLTSMLFMFALATTGAGAQEVPDQTKDPVKPSAVTHDITGKEACMVCHAIGASPILDVPADHSERAIETCMWCHAPDSPMLTVQPSNTPHRRATSETDCMRCHGPEADPEVTSIPPTHEGRGTESCMWCHVKVEGGGG